jgi:prepilin-type N-terminal cleavage/methylation domain-containing protein
MVRDRRRPLVDERGFTLVEMLVLVGIIAILSIVAAPTFLSYIQSSTLQAGARELASTINRGRQLAISRNTTVCVQLIGTDITMRTALCSTGPLYTGPGTDGNGVIRLTNGMRVSFAGGTSVVFNNLGAATTVNTFTVTNPVTNGTRSVVVSASGQVSVQ